MSKQDERIRKRGYTDLEVMVAWASIRAASGLNISDADAWVADRLNKHLAKHKRKLVTEDTIRLIRRKHEKATQADPEFQGQDVIKIDVKKGDLVRSNGLVNLNYTEKDDAVVLTIDGKGNENTWWK